MLPDLQDYVILSLAAVHCQIHPTAHGILIWVFRYRINKMAGRILPIALATFAGVAIGVSTFGEEFKEQQRRRLQQEYNRYEPDAK